MKREYFKKIYFLFWLLIILEVFVSQAYAANAPKGFCANIFSKFFGKSEKKTEKHLKEEKKDIPIITNTSNNVFQQFRNKIAEIQRKYEEIQTKLIQTKESKDRGEIKDRESNQRIAIIYEQQIYFLQKQLTRLQKMSPGKDGLNVDQTLQYYALYYHKFTDGIAQLNAVDKSLKEWNELIEAQKGLTKDQQADYQITLWMQQALHGMLDKLDEQMKILDQLDPTFFDEMIKHD